LAAKVVKSGSSTSLDINGMFTSSKNNLSPVIDLDRCSVITISNRVDRPAATTTAGHNVVANYFAETDPAKGSALAKYITKTVQLDETSDQLKVYLDVNRPSFTNVEVYYKTSAEASTFDTLSWTLIAPGVGSVPYSDAGEYSEMEYTIDVSDFSLFALKIVFTSQTTAKVPSVQSLRAIALQA